MTDDLRVLVASDQEDRFAPLLRGRFPNVAFRFLKDRHDVPTALADFQPTIILGMTGEPVPKDEFPEMVQYPSVRWFSNAGAGIEHLGSWNANDLTVTNASGVNAAYLAEYTIAALITANLGFPEYAQHQRAKVWRSIEWKALQDCRICIVGLGHVGRAVAAQAKHFGMTVVGTRGTARPTENVDAVFGADDLHEALRGADFVSVHAAHTPATENLIDDAAFAAMQDGAILLNAARGPLVDDDALLRALTSGKIRTAILDVMREEPPAGDHPFWDHPQIVITPHMADSTQIWRENMVRAFADNLDRWIRDEPLVNVVDSNRGY